MMLRLLLPALLAISWQALAVVIDKPTTLPRLEAVGNVLAHPTEKILITGSLVENSIISLIRVACGFCLAAAAAIPLGILMGYFGLAERLFESAIELLRPVPPLAWVPLILAWFGIKALLIGFRSRAIL